MRKVSVLLSCGAASQNYVEAISALGAEATASYLPTIDTSYDGLILCGGTDINPARYAEELNGSVDIDFERDAAEFALLQAYIDAGKPILGICRGCQLINVFFGGSLYQDLPEADRHKGKNNVDSVHNVTAIADSIVGRLYGERFAVNSSHHQAVKRLGDGLRASANWNGQYIEAIEHNSYPIFAVQWPPERMCFRNKREDTVSGADILLYFLAMCQAYRKEK